MRRWKHRAAWAVASLLLFMLVGCSVRPPTSGHGAVFEIPEAAWQDALGEHGWLGRLEDGVKHFEGRTEQGAVALYSGRYQRVSDRAGSTTELAIVLVDAKPRGGGWYAHGLYGLDAPPPVSGGALLSCSTASLQMSGERFLVIAGHADPLIGRVEVLFSDGTAQVAPLRDGLFATATQKTAQVAEVRAFDEEDALVAQRAGGTCESG